MPTLTEIDSSLLYAIGYDDDEGVLFVRFRDTTDGPAALWRYEEVPPDVWDAFQHSKSKGRYFLRSIKGIYAGSKVQE